MLLCYAISYYQTHLTREDLALPQCRQGWHQRRDREGAKGDVAPLFGKYQPPVGK